MNKEDIEQQIHEFAELMYKTGYEDGQKDKPSVFYEQYKQGLDDAWECARKILFDYTLTDVKEKFGTDTFCGIIEKYSASETIAKIKEYEEKQKRVEIKVGDEVYLLDGNYHSVVTSLFEEGKKAVLITQNGKWSTEFISNLRKTCRHFKEIEYVLKQMKGDNNE
jgi:hypothetical protein